MFGDPLWFHAGACSGSYWSALSKTCSDNTLLKMLGNASIVIFPVHALFWLLPDRFFSIVTWYARKIADADVLVAAIISVIEIAACLFISPSWLGRHA